MRGKEAVKLFHLLIAVLLAVQYAFKAGIQKVWTYYSKPNPLKS